MNELSRNIMKRGECMSLELRGRMKISRRALKENEGEINK